MLNILYKVSIEDVGVGDLVLKGLWYRLLGSGRWAISSS